MGAEREKNAMLEQRINDYLGKFKSGPDADDRGDRANELAEDLDNYLIERAVADLRAARSRLDALKRNLGKDIP